MRKTANRSSVSQIREILAAGLRDRTDIRGALEFGSAARGKQNPNDYDLIVVTTHDFVIPRNLYLDLSELVFEAQMRSGLRVEMLVRDEAILSTFYSNFGKIFRRHLDEHGKVIHGSDPRPLFTNSFTDSLSRFIGKVQDFSTFTEALEWEVHRLSATRKHATMLLTSASDECQAQFSKAMAKLKMAEHARNVLILNNVHLKYEDTEGIFTEMRRAYGPEIADGLRDIEALRETKMPRKKKVNLFFDALELRELIAKVTSKRVKPF